MATISTHPLSGDLRREVLTISVDPSSVDPDGVGKSGYWKLVINSITWTGTGLDANKKFDLDIRTPQFNEENDEPLVNHKTVTSNAMSVAPDKTTHVLSLIYGRVGPSAYKQGDNTYDVVKIAVDLGYTDITNFVLTVNYTLTFVEITTSTLSMLSTATPTLNVTNDRPTDGATLTVTPSTGYGVYVVVAQQLDTSVFDGVSSEDSVPNFSLATMPTYNGYSEGLTLLSHPISKSAVHTKTYAFKTAVLVFAVNNGKIDALGSKVKIQAGGSVVNYHVLGQAVLTRFNEWPTDDVVDATFTYKYGFLTA